VEVVVGLAGVVVAGVVGLAGVVVVAVVGLAGVVVVAVVGVLEVRRLETLANPLRFATFPSPSMEKVLTGFINSRTKLLWNR
jgi:hypothetical protein